MKLKLHQQFLESAVLEEAGGQAIHVQWLKSPGQQ